MYLTLSFIFLKVHTNQVRTERQRYFNKLFSYIYNKCAFVCTYNLIAKNLIECAIENKQVLLQT